MKLRRVKILTLCWLAVLLSAPVLALAQPANFGTSLHATRAGKNYWYSAANGGYEALTNIPIEQLGCIECHGPTDADGNPYPAEFPGASCIDCHNSTDMAVSQDQCYGCHGRQATEVKLGISDVHRDAGLVCWDCGPCPSWGASRNEMPCGPSSSAPRRNSALGW